jgi:4-hydroxybenzoate polyprenyltransferase
VSDALAFSSLWAGAVAVALLLAAARAMGLEATIWMGLLAFSGTVVVYGVDRLRDVERDRLTAPDRTAFVERHRPALIAVCGASGLIATAAAWTLGPAVCVLCGGVLGLGLAHRRLKHVPIFKGLYVTVAWLAVVVGVPALSALSQGPPGPPRWATEASWTAGILGAAILGNVVASSLRDSEAGAGRSPRLALAIARSLPVLGLLLAWLGPPGVRPLAWVPAALLLALGTAPGDERHGLLIVDGALLVGALLSLL